MCLSPSEAPHQRNLPPPSENKRQRINKHPKQSKINEEGFIITHSSLPQVFEQQRQAPTPTGTPSARRTQTANPIPIPPATASRTQDPLRFPGRIHPPAHDESQFICEPRFFSCHYFVCVCIPFKQHKIIFCHASTSPHNHVAT